jgi:uncharacterized membrane protein (UPF0127 family)
MFSRRHNLLFIFDKPRIVSLHMLFVFFSVDALILDKDMKVLDIICMKPFRIGYKSRYRGKYVLELTEDYLYRIGDIVWDL